MSCNPYTNEDLEKIGMLIDEGLSMRQIADKMNRPYDSLRKRAYLVRPGGTQKNTPWTKDQEDELIYDLRQGKSWRAIANKLKRSPNACQVHYQEMLWRTKGTNSQAEILIQDKFGNSRRTKAVAKIKSVVVDPGDIYGLWCRAMDAVRRRKQA